MKQGILAVGACAALFASVCAATAQPMPIPAPGYYDSRAYYPPPPPVVRYAVAPPVEAAGMPSYEVARVLRQNGFMPLGGPSRRGDFYSVSAIHPNGDDGRVVIDAYTGRVVRFVPASRFILDHGNDEMVMVYRGPNFPPPDTDRGMRAPPSAVAPPMGTRPPVAANPPPVIHAPKARPPQVASRTPSAAPVTTPKPRPQVAPKNPSTAQAPPATTPQAAKPAEEAKPAPVAAPPAETRPIEAKPAAPAIPAPAPTGAMPPVQTME
jgi:hypothetical protein